MILSIQVEPESGIAIATCSGVLRLSDAKGIASALWNTPAWMGKSAVWDFRQTRFDASSSDVREIAWFIVENQPPTPPVRVAWVTQSDFEFGMARIFEVFREDPHTAFRVFRDYDEAVCWARSLESPAA
jgi:hypothetical protein